MNIIVNLEICKHNCKYYIKQIKYSNQIVKNHKLCWKNFIVLNSHVLKYHMIQRRSNSHKSNFKIIWGVLYRKCTALSDDMKKPEKLKIKQLYFLIRKLKIVRITKSGKFHLPKVVELITYIISTMWLSSQKKAYSLFIPLESGKKCVTIWKWPNCPKERIFMISFEKTQILTLPILNVTWEIYVCLIWVPFSERPSVLPDGIKELTLLFLTCP